MGSIILAIVIMMVVGGGIAYLADWLGLTMGKKRLTLFGMRPRNTARFLTVIGGSLIALLTFLLLLAVNKGFYIAISRGAEILRTNHALTQANRILEADKSSAIQSANNAKNEATEAESRRSLAATMLGQTEIRLTAANLADHNAVLQLQARQAKLQTITSQLTQAETQVAKAQKLSAVLEVRNASVEKNLSEFVKTVPPKIIHSRQNSLIYRNGAEIARVVIKAGLPIAETRQQITGFIAQMSAQALQRGAVRGQNGRAVQVATVAILSEGGKGTSPSNPTTFADESQSVSALADQIETFNIGFGSVVVVANALGNAFAGEQTIITLSPYVNRLALKRGTVLGQTVISPTNESTAEILATLEKFLVKTVRPAAIRAGVIPVVDPQIHDEQVGNVSLTDLYNLVNQIRSIPGAAVVSAVADDDTYSSDQVSLDFDVKPANTSSASTTQ